MSTIIHHAYQWQHLFRRPLFWTLGPWEKGFMLTNPVQSSLPNFDVCTTTIPFWDEENWDHRVSGKAGTQMQPAILHSNSEDLEHIFSWQRFFAFWHQIATICFSMLSSLRQRAERYHAQGDVQRRHGTRRWLGCLLCCDLSQLRGCGRTWQSVRHGLNHTLVDYNLLGTGWFLGNFSPFDLNNIHSIKTMEADIQESNSSMLQRYWKQTFNSLRKKSAVFEFSFRLTCNRLV